MAIRMICGFETGFLPTEGPTKFFQNLDWAAYSTNARTGTYACRIQDTANGVVKIFDNQSTWIVGIACYQTVMPSGANGNYVVSLLDTGTHTGYSTNSHNQIALRITSAGELELLNGSTQRGITSGLGIVINTWYYIELKATIHGSTGSYEVRVDGTTKLSGSSLDLASTANNYANAVKWGPNESGGFTYHFDDLYVLDGTGASDNDFWGPIKIERLAPTGAGNYTQFTPSAGSNWQTIDENGTGADTDYNSSSTAGHKDSFVFSNTTLTGAIKAVSIVATARMDDAGPRTLRSFVRLSGTDYPGSAGNMASVYDNFHNSMGQNPATGSAWTTSEVDGAEFGYELVS